MGNNNDKGLCIIGQEKSDTNLKLLEEAKKKFSSVFFVPLEGIGIGLDRDFSISYRVSDLFKFKAVYPRIPKTSSSYGYQLLSLFPEDTYMPVKPISFLLADERFFLLTVLRKRGVSTLNLKLTRSTNAALSIIEGMKFPIMIRTPEKETGVIVKNKIEAKSVIGALVSLNKPILIEDVVKEMVSVYVTQPEVAAAVKKKTKERDVVFAKGELKKQNIDPAIEQLALDASKAIEAEVVRIDISPEKEPKVVNVELNPGLINASKATKINLAEKFISSIYENFRNYQQRPLLMRFFEDAKSVVKDVLKAKQLL